MLAAMTGGLLLLLCPGSSAKYCDENVLMSVRSHVSKNMQKPREIFCIVAVARSCFDNSAIRYVLPVLYAIFLLPPR